MKIIIIDDEAEISELMARKIKKEFPECVILGANNYQDGIVMIRTFPDMAYYILDGDLGDQEKTGIDILKAMTLEQRNHTIFASYNPVLTEQAVKEFGVTAWVKTDIVNGLKNKIAALESSTIETRKTTLRDISKMKICNCCSGIKTDCWKVDSSSDLVCVRIKDFESFINAWAKQEIEFGMRIMCKEGLTSCKYNLKEYIEEAFKI